MSKFANVVTIEVAPGRRDQVVTSLLAHKARLKAESGTLQFEVLLPKDGERKFSRTKCTGTPPHSRCI
jgi:(4S)-4-hydroxy-5-phosphonooxypentane-2,3-dione isomerase